MKEIKDYFYNYLLKPISELVFNQRIYKDFQKACILKGLSRDNFTDFVDINYYKVTITDLCRLLDYPRREDDRNFMGFIKLFKEEEANIIKSRSNIPVFCLDSKTTKNVDISDKIESDFNKVEHDKKLKELEEKFKIFQEYRNKINCHQTSKNVESPSRENIDKTISLLEDLLLIYARLFGICIVSLIPNPIYKNALLSKKE